MNTSEVGILVEKRIGAEAASRLRLQTLIPTGLNNLAREVVNDYTKRRLLLTDQTLVTTGITASGGTYFADLDSIISTYGVMVDYLQYGTVYHYNTAAFTSAAVNIDPTNTITLAAHPFSSGDAVVFATTGTLGSPFVAGTVYYVIKAGANVIQLATTYANATAAVPVPITITTTGSGNSTITSTDINLLQWIDAPEFASLPSSLPVSFFYGWMVKNKLYTTAATGALRFAVPFIPTLETLPEQLDTDLIDEIVTIVTTGGGEPHITEAQK